MTNHIATLNKMKRSNEQVFIFSILSNLLANQMALLDGNFKHQVKQDFNNLKRKVYNIVNRVERQVPYDIWEGILENECDFITDMINIGQQIPREDREKFLHTMKTTKLIEPLKS